MRLAAPNGDSVDLRIAGYQYPELTGSGWDANWLVVAGQVRTGAGEWAFRDPCLTTWEARDLASWLRGIADDHSEPNAAVIRVFLSHEAVPWSTTGEYVVELAIPHESVGSAADDWAAELRAYPVRA